MSHLSTERLSALGDEEPTAAEAAHLAGCAACARERAAYQSLVAMARAERDAIGIPLTRWESIAGALAEERVGIATAAPARALPVAARGRTVRFLHTPMRAAAGILLLAGGAVVGRLSAGAPPLPVATGVSLPGFTSPSVGSPAAQLPDSTAFTSVEEARAAQLRSETIYQQAASFLAQHDTTGSIDASPEAVRSRLAALDQMITTTREAMREAPHDPVINGYYLTTVGQREATLRQLNTVLPASLRANSF